jgi:hypothetical protein
MTIARTPAASGQFDKRNKTVSANRPKLSNHPWAWLSADHEHNVVVFFDLRGERAQFAAAIFRVPDTLCEAPAQSVLS